MKRKKIKHILSFIKGKMNERELRQHLMNSSDSDKVHNRQKQN